MIEKDKNGKAISPKNGSGGSMLPRDAFGKLLLPKDQNGNVIVPVDSLGSNIVPTDDSGLPLPEDIGKPIPPVDKNGNQIVFENGQIVYGSNRACDGRIAIEGLYNNNCSHDIFAQNISHHLELPLGRARNSDDRLP